MKPALTPEEWSNASDPDIWPGLLYEKSYLWGKERPQAVAAMCLRGQPFGFTWEDVKLLIDAANVYELGYTDEGGVDRPNRELRDLADRIGSLLPPEKS